MVYIIEYNAETDYEKVYTKREAEALVKRLIEDGYGATEIVVFEAEPLDFSVTNATISISVIKEESNGSK